MKKYITLLFIAIIALSFTTGCESKNLTSYIKEKEISKEEKIGYIEMKKSKFKKLATQDEFKKLMDYAKKQKYDYLIVAFDKNKGLYCLSPNCIYEDIDKNSEGTYIPTMNIYGRVQKGDDGDYKYIKFEDNKNTE